MDIYQVASSACIAHRTMVSQPTRYQQNILSNMRDLGLEQVHESLHTGNNALVS